MINLLHKAIAIIVHGALVWYAPEIGWLMLTQPVLGGAMAVIYAIGLRLYLKHGLHV